MKNNNLRIQKLLQELKAECPECRRYLSKDDMVKTMDAGTICKECAGDMERSYEKHGIW